MWKYFNVTTALMISSDFAFAVAPLIFSVKSWFWTKEKQLFACSLWYRKEKLQHKAGEIEPGKAEGK